MEVLDMTRLATPSAGGPAFWVGVASFLLGACAPALAQNPPGEGPDRIPGAGTLQVSGQATLEVPADRVEMSFAVETEAPSAQVASQANAQAMDAVVRALRTAGVPGLELETFGYSLRPEYQVSREGQGVRTISGYRAQNNVRVELPDVSAAGRVLDLALQAGANRVSDLVFRASDTRSARLQALREAVASAREEAQTIAEAMGVTLGPVLEVQGGASAPPPRGFEVAAMRFAEAAAPTPIEPGTQSVSASVSITYRILEPGR
jgi:uncharacterized protein YggE